MAYLVAYSVVAMSVAIVAYVINGSARSDGLDKMLNAAMSLGLGAIWPLTLLGLLVVVVGEAVRPRLRGRR